MRTKEEIVRAFTRVEKLSEPQKMRIQRLEESFKVMATDIEDLAPDCADRTAALRKLLEAKWTATQAVTHGMEAAQPGSRAGGKPATEVPQKEKAGAQAQ